MLTLLVFSTLAQTVVLFATDVIPARPIPRHYRRLPRDPDGGLTLTPANDVAAVATRLAA